jgi:hypothetical protein
LLSKSLFDRLDRQLVCVFCFGKPCIWMCLEICMCKRYHAGVCAHYVFVCLLYDTVVSCMCCLRLCICGVEYMLDIYRDNRYVIGGAGQGIADFVF